MNKTELIKKVAKETNVSESNVKAVINTFIEDIVKGVSEEGTVSIKGFGTFKKVVTKERSGFNPHTLQPMIIPQKVKMTFSTSDSVNDIV